jgi:hypothetical protein
MTAIWIWRITGYEAPETPHDITGFDVEATDGHIGTIDEATNDAGTGLIVVDTGFWIFGKQRLIPAGVVVEIDDDARVVHLGCTKDEVKGAPDYDAVRRDHEEYRDEVAGHYQRFHGDPIAPTAGIGDRPADELRGDPIGPTAGRGEEF